MQGYIVSETATELEAGSRKDPSWDEWYGSCTTGVAGNAISRGMRRYPNWNGLGGNTGDGTTTDGNDGGSAAGSATTSDNGNGQGDPVLMATMYDSDSNRVFQIDNTYKWEEPTPRAIRLRSTLTT